MEQERLEKLAKDKEKAARIDFKMVTFTLAGRDYALDIMKVKEISKANKFTYVPNASPFVKGVYNLRGDIISVIDLRIFFNQFDRSMAAERGVVMENMIILRLEDHTIAVIVDTIEKVVGVSREDIQPPHPLFGDINIKYISGVVEKNDKLYVILDVERIFNSEDTPEVKSTASVPVPIVPVQSGLVSDKNEEDINLKFVLESLVTFKLFYPSAVNQKWIKLRFKEWQQTRKASGKEVQFSGESDAREFLMGFSSPYSGELWDQGYADAVAEFIDPSKSGNFTVWNPGCSKGAETYSVARMLKGRNHALNLKVLANDNDLINISTAPGLVFSAESLSDYYKPFMVESSTGSQFQKEIKDSIIFEYHDITHDNNLPPLDMVVMRDVLSRLPLDKQKRILLELEENMKPGSLLLLGKNEELQDSRIWQLLEKNGLKIYKKK